MTQHVTPFLRTLRYTVRKHFLNTATSVDEWFHDRGDETLSIVHPLTQESVVFEVGAYRGLWASRIAALYNPRLYLFEPVQSAYLAAAELFKGNPKATVIPHGLGDRSEQVAMVLAGDASSAYLPNGGRQTVSLVDVYAFVREAKLDIIDLIQINIEGGEYRLLTRMLDTGVAQCCRAIQVQFHSHIPGAVEERTRIRERLSQSHTLVYDYPFVWELWRITVQ